MSKKVNDDLSQFLGDNNTYSKCSKLQKIKIPVKFMYNIPFLKEAKSSKRKNKEKTQ